MQHNNYGHNTTQATYTMSLVLNGHKIMKALNCQTLGVFQLHMYNICIEHEEAQSLSFA